MQRRDAGRVLHKADNRKLGPLHALDLQPGFVPRRPVPCLDILGDDAFHLYCAEPLEYRRAVDRKILAVENRRLQPGLRKQTLAGATARPLACHFRAFRRASDDEAAPTSAALDDCLSELST